MLRSFLGFSIVGAISIGAMAMGPTIGVFFDLPSVLFVTGLTLGGTLLAFPLEQIQSAIASLGGTPPEDDGPAEVFHRMADLSIASGLFGTLIGLVQMLHHLDDPNALGPAMGVALLTILYGVGMGELVFRGLAAGHTAAPGSAAIGRRRGAASVYVAMCGLLLVLGVFGMMVLTLFVG